MLVGLRFEAGLPLGITRLNATSPHLQLPKSFVSAHQIVLAYNVGKNMIPIVVHIEKRDDPHTTIESLIMTTQVLHISIITEIAPI